MATPSTESPAAGRGARVAYFGAGLVAAALPLLAAIDKLAEHKAAIAVVIEVVRQVGWPGILVIVGALLLRQQAADHRDALQAVGGELQAAVRQLVAGLGEVKAEVAGLHQRLDLTDPTRKV